MPLAYLLLAFADVPAAADIGGLFREEDYPTEALRARATGTASALVNVASDGRPTNCRIIQSSRSASLDAATCRIFMERARFTETAKRHRGKAFKIRVPVQWVLTDRQIIGTYEVRIVYTIADGKARQCRIEPKMEFAVPDLCGNTRMMVDAEVAQLDKDRKSDGLEYVIESVMLPGAHRDSSGIGAGDEKDITGGGSYVVTIDAEGNVKNCEIIEQTFTNEIDQAICDHENRRKYDPLPPDTTNRGLRQVTQVLLRYLRPALPAASK